MAGQVVCWLCGGEYRTSVTECPDCALPLLAADDRVGPTEDQRRIRALADQHLSRRERDRVRPALAALPDVLLEDEAVVWLTDARNGRREGVLVITTQALCWVPVDQEAEPGAIDLGTIEAVEPWPGDGGQLRVTTVDDLHVFAEVGAGVWLGQFAEVLRATIDSPQNGRAMADHHDHRQ